VHEDWNIGLTWSVFRTGEPCSIPGTDLEDRPPQMKYQSQLVQLWRRPYAGRVKMHALVLFVLGLAIGISTVAASAETAPSASSLGPWASQVAPAQTPADVQLRVGETVDLDGGLLQVTLTEVREDSRCPMDAMCVWTGRAVVVMHVVLDGVDRGDLTATLYPSPRNQPSPELDAAVDRYVLSLADLQPYPAASQPQPLDQRVATIHIESTDP
jgi:hypothetical protein